MKRTLSLLALIAALVPLSPLTAEGTEQHIVQGITFQNPGEWNTATGWYDANKSWSGDSLLCWAATCSNLITWWQVQNGYEDVQLSDVWNEYRDTFVNGSGIIGTGLKWWFDGTGTGSADYELHLKPGVTNPGGHYKENLAGGTVETGKQNILTLSTSTYGNATDLSKALTSYIDKGYAVGVNFINGQQGHAETIWGVECDETGLITTVYLADSDDTKNKPDVPAIRTEPVIVKELGGKQVLALEYSQNWSVESVVVLTPTLSNDVKYLNYVDDNANVILKQKVGAGYTLPEGTESINNIVYDGSRGSVDRQLTVDAAHDGLNAGVIQAAPTSGTNLLEVLEGVTLTARDVTGPGTLVKTGKGTLAIGNSQTTIEVRGGTLASGGTLSDIVVNGGELEADGTFMNINVQQGTLAVGGEKPGCVTVKGTLTLSNANLEFFVGGWETKASANDGWDSGTYSWIDMGYSRQRFSVKGEDGIKSIVIHVGGDALDALSTTGSFTLDLINEFWSFDFLDSYLDGMKEHTTILVADDEDALVGTNWQAGQDITNLINFGYQFNNGSSWYSSSAIQMVGTFTGVDPPIPPYPVPEPTTGTLSMLALAGLIMRRRRK